MKTKLAIIGLATVSALALGSAPVATFTVANTTDSGSGSLRQAILDANAASGDDLITFTVTGTITLASALPAINDNTTIAGPGTNLLTISGNNAVQVFTVNAGTTTTITGLSIANGKATGYANGAGVSNAGTLTILNCALVNNQNFAGWGGAVFNSGDLAIINSTFSGNQVTGENGSGSAHDGVGDSGGGGGAAGLGGGLCSLSGTVVITGCTFTSNNATGGNGGGGPGGSGRGGGINGGQVGSSTLCYNFGCAGDPGGFAGGGGGGGAGISGSGGGGQGGFGGGSGGHGTSTQNSYSGGKGGSGVGGGIYVDSGTLTILDCSFAGNQSTGGMGGAGGTATGGNGTGFVGGVYTRNGTVTVQNSIVNVLTTNTPTEIWTNGQFQYLAPVGTPKFFADGQFVLGNGNIVKRGSAQISLQTSFPAGTIVYSLDGSDPRTQPRLYTGPFTVKSSTLLRAVAYNSTFATSVEMDPVQITILPTLTTATYGGGTVSIAPTNGAYFSNSTAQITAQPASGCAFLQWLGDASGTNPVTTVTMIRNKYVQAVFGTALATNVVGGGSLLIDPALPLYPFGTTVKFTAQPQTGNYFAQWGASASGTNNPVSFVVSNANPNVAAIFLTLSGNKYALTVIENGHGHVLENPRANAFSNSQSVSLTALPDAGHDFIAWTGDASGTQNPLLVTVSSNKVITANFSKRPSLRVGTPLEGLVEDGFRLTLAGEFGTPYTILGSTNFVDWTVAGMVTNTYGTVQLTDPVATNLLYRFYRAATN